MPARPVGDFDNSKHAGLRRGLAAAFAGLAEMGGEMNGHPGVGMGFVNRWQNQDEAQRTYDANAGRYKAAAGNQAYENYLGEAGKTGEVAKTGAETALTEQQTKNLSMVGPPGKQDFLKEFVGKVQTGQYDPQQLFNEYVNRGAAFGVTRGELVNLLNNTPETPPVFKIGPQGIREPIQYHGKNWYGDEPDAPDVIKNAAANAGNVEDKVHKNKVEEQAAARSNVILKNEGAQSRQNSAEDFSNTEKGRGEASKHLQTLREAQNQNDLVQQLASSTSPTDQTSLAFKALGLDLPDGVHRINEAELNAIKSQGGLGDKAYKTLLNWKSGEQFAPEILQDIKQTAQKIANSKIKTANDNLEDVYRNYGYRVEGSSETGRLDKPAAPKAGGSANNSPKATHRYNSKTGKIEAIQ